MNPLSASVGYTPHWESEMDWSLPKTLTFDYFKIKRVND